VEVDSASVPTLCCAVSKGSATSFQVIRGNISVMTTLKFTYFFINEVNNILLKIIAKILQLEMRLFRITFRISNNESLV
jgi:hypothetical protein